MPISLSGSLVLTGSLTATSTITAQTLVVQTITSSVVQMTGSNVFGSTLANTQTFTGSMLVTGSGTFASSLTATSVIADGTSNEGVIRIERDTVSTNTAIGSLIFTNNNAVTTYGKIFGGRNSAGDGYVALGTGVSNNLYALESGYVGIGTSSPTTPLHISGSAAAMTRITSTFSLTSGYADAFQMLFSNQTGGGVSLNIGKAESQNDLAKMVYFHSSNGSTSNRLGFGFYNNDNLFNILANGSVGIGTTSPSGILTVAAAQNLSVFRSTTTTNYVELQIENTTNYLQIGVEGASGNRMGGTIAYNAYLGSYANYGMTFHTNNLNRMTIANGGNVYINTTSNPVTDNASPQLGILAGAGTDAVNIKHTQNGNNTINIWQTGTSIYSAIAFYKGDVQTNRGLIRVDTSGTSYTSVSDYRLKENIVPLENGLDRVLQLKPSKFNWIETGDETEGFIAHELQEIFPGAVTGEKDAVYSSTGNIKPQSVDYGRITPLLVKAIQELEARVKELENK